MCPACGSHSHGRPVLAPVNGTRLPWVSISRTRDLTVVALSDAGPIGVDVECVPDNADPALARVALHPMERVDGSLEEMRTWVRKESLLKAMGTGLRIDPSTIRLSSATESPPRLLEAPPEFTGDVPAQMYDVTVTARHVVALTVLSQTRPPLDVRRIGAEGRVAPSRSATCRTTS